MSKYFSCSDVNITSGSISIQEILDLLSQGKMFFTESERWSCTQQARFIESILARIPTPTLYFDETENTVKIVDGNQRVYALMNFFINESLTLDNLEYRSDLLGLSASEIHPADKRRILYTYIDRCRIDKGTPKAIVENIWERVKGNERR